MTWLDGRRYEGEWKEEKYHGQGIWTNADGTKYRSEWNDGVEDVLKR